MPATAANVLAISAGHYHNAALRADGSLLAWGNENSEDPVLPSGIPDVASMAAGEAGNLVWLGTGQPRLGRPLRSITARAGGQTILQLAVPASHPATIQWLQEGVPVDGATNRSFTVVRISRFPDHATRNDPVKP